MLDNVDIPRLEAIFGIGKKSGPAQIEEAGEFVPVETIKSDQFDALLGELGIPVKQKTGE